MTDHETTDRLDSKSDVTEIPLHTHERSSDSLPDISPADTHSSSQRIQGKAPREKLWTKDFLVITLVNFLLFCGFQLFPSSLPLYVKELGAPDNVIGWITGLTTISALVIRPFGGLILDRFGRKGIFILSLLLMIGVSFSFAFIPLVGVILLMRFVQGLGWGVATTATSTIASDVIPRKQFGEGMGYFSLSTSLAMAIAPGVSIMLFHAVGMTTVAYIATAALVFALLLAIVMRYQPAPKADPDKPRTKIRLFERGAVFPAIVMFFVTASYGSIVTFVALFADAEGVGDIGIFFTVYAVVLLASRPFLGRLVDSKGAAYTVIPGIIALIAALVILAFSHSLWMFLLCATLYGFGFGALQSGLQTLAVASAPPDRRGSANATFFIGFDGGIGFGSIVSGFVVAAVGYSSMYLVFAALPLVAGVVFLTRARTLPE